MVESGKCSAARPSNEFWAKLVPSDSRCLDVEIRSDGEVICSDIMSSSSDKHDWCKIIRSSELRFATLENKSPNAIIVDGVVVYNDDMVVIENGSEIIPGPDREGFLSYAFNIVSSPGTCQGQLKINIEVGHAKCSICLNVWHGVVTAASYLHNFCQLEDIYNSEAKDILRADSFLRCSDEEVAVLNSYSLVRSNLVIESRKKHCRKRAYPPST